MTSLSLRGRLTLWYTLTLVVVLVLFGGDILLVQTRLGVLRVDRELDSVHVTLAKMLQEELRELDSPPLAAAEATNAIGALGEAIAVLDVNGAPLAAQTSGVPLGDLMATPDQRGVTTKHTPAGDWRVHVQGESFGPVAMTLVVARSLDDVEREQSQVRQAMVFGIPLALCLAGVGGLWLASVGLRPITLMARRAKSIPPTGLEDLGQPPRDDELGQLASAFNGLVARLRAALQTQRQFMADASHELRTPVSVIRTATDVALSREHRGESEYREALAVSGAQARRLGRLVEDMLVLARADAGAYPLRPVDVYLDDLIEECRRAVSLLAPDRDIIVRCVTPIEVVVHGDEELLRRLLVNVLQNAVQHSPPGGIVIIDVRAGGARVAIRIADNGAGIPEAERARVFERFVQLDPSRRGEGTGLGLTIAKWIAEAHQGALTLESSVGAGCTFCVELPLAATVRAGHRGTISF